LLVYIGGAPDLSACRRFAKIGIPFVSKSEKSCPV
jgi:hypothetical protein